jgi:hypothetical protein
VTGTTISGMKATAVPAAGRKALLAIVALGPGVGICCRRRGVSS